MNKTEKFNLKFPGIIDNIKSDSRHIDECAKFYNFIFNEKKYIVKIKKNIFDDIEILNFGEYLDINFELFFDFFAKISRKPYDIFMDEFLDSTNLLKNFIFFISLPIQLLMAILFFIIFPLLICLFLKIYRDLFRCNFIFGKCIRKLEFCENVNSSPNNNVMINNFIGQTFTSTSTIPAGSSVYINNEGNLITSVGQTTSEILNAPIGVMYAENLHISSGNSNISDQSNNINIINNTSLNNPVLPQKEIKQNKPNKKDDNFNKFKFLDI